MNYITNGTTTLSCNYISNYNNYAYDDESVKRNCVVLHEVQDTDFNSLKAFLEGGNYKEIVNTTNPVTDENGNTTEEEVTIEKDTLDGYNIIVAITDKRDGTFDVILGTTTEKEELQETADLLLLETLGV